MSRWSRPSGRISGAVAYGLGDRAEHPILFIDTLMLFEETLQYQRDVADKLGLTDVRVITAEAEALAFEDPDNTLHQFSTDACCALRKTVPLENALSKFDAWITGVSATKARRGPILISSRSKPRPA